MRISDWSSDGCSSDLAGDRAGAAVGRPDAGGLKGARETSHAKAQRGHFSFPFVLSLSKHRSSLFNAERKNGPSTSSGRTDECPLRSEEHTSELQSLMRNSYAVFCLKKKKKHLHNHKYDEINTYTT